MIIEQDNLSCIGFGLKTDPRTRQIQGQMTEQN
jgi:hypothetical protein